MRFLVMHVGRKDRQPGLASEGHACCWINDPDRGSARARAIRQIEEQGWSVNDVLEDYEIRREDYALKPEGLDYYEQALTDDEVVVFFVVDPSSATDAEEYEQDVNLL